MEDLQSLWWDSLVIVGSVISFCFSGRCFMTTVTANYHSSGTSRPPFRVFCIFSRHCLLLIFIHSTLSFPVVSKNYIFSSIQLVFQSLKTVVTSFASWLVSASIKVFLLGSWFRFLFFTEHIHKILVVILITTVLPQHILRSQHQFYSDFQSWSSQISPFDFR